jgi:hypothetical protein
MVNPKQCGQGNAHDGEDGEGGKIVAHLPPADTVFSQNLHHTTMSVHTMKRQRPLQLLRSTVWLSTCSRMLQLSSAAMAASARCT